MASYHLAELNVARMKAPLDDPLMQDFVALLESVNAEADRSPGFVWRLQTEAGDATAARIFDDPLILANLSVWESLETFQHFTYRSIHVQPFRERRKWFTPIAGPTLALWWIPAGHIPTLEEAKARLEKLSTHGPTREAFTFKQAFPHDAM